MSWSHWSDASLISLSTLWSPFTERSKIQDVLHWILEIVWIRPFRVAQWIINNKLNWWKIYVSTFLRKFLFSYNRFTTRNGNTEQSSFLNRTNWLILKKFFYVFSPLLYFSGGKSILIFLFFLAIKISKKNYFEMTTTTHGNLFLKNDKKRNFSFFLLLNKERRLSRLMGYLFIRQPQTHAHTEPHKRILQSPDISI